MQLLVIWITVIIVALTLWNRTMGSTEVSYVTSRIEDRSKRGAYLVRNLPDKQVAADHLHRLHIKLDNFIKAADIKPIHIVLSESTESKYTSYTVNKHTIYMCLRERESRGFVDQNTLFFVALHELTHVITPSIGHTKEYWNNFKALLHKAIKLGYYKYHPYHQSPKKYCGIYISDTPLKLDA